MNIKKSIALFAALLVVIALSGCYIGGLNWGDFRYSFDDSFEADLEGIREIDLTIVNGKIIVSTWEEDRIEIDVEERIKAHDEEEAEELADEVTLRGDERGSTLKIELDYGDLYNKRRNYSCNLFVRIPERLALTLETTNGSIEIEAIEGDVVAVSTNGKIELDGTEGDANLHTTNGSISVMSVKGELIARTTNGGIEFESVSGDVDASTTNGRINATVSDPLDGNIELSTTNGGIDLIINPDRGFDIRASTSNGKIRDSLPSANFDYNRRKTHMEGRYKGGGKRVILHTTNGGIRIDSE